MTEIGEYFVNKCLAATTTRDPWPHTQFVDGLPTDSFNKLKKSIENIDEERLIVEQTVDSDKKTFTKDDFPTLKEFNNVNSEELLHNAIMNCKELDKKNSNLRKIL